MAQPGQQSCNIQLTNKFPSHQGPLQGPHMANRVQPLHRSSPRLPQVLFLLAFHTKRNWSVFPAKPVQMQLTPVQQEMVRNNRERAIMKRKLLDERDGVRQCDANLNTERDEKRMQQVDEGAKFTQHHAELDTEQVEKCVKKYVECFEDEHTAATSHPGFPYVGIMCCVCERLVCILIMLNSKCHTIQMSVRL